MITQSGSSSQRRPQLQRVTTEALRADKAAVSAKEKARVAKAKLKAAKKQVRAAKQELKDARKMARKALKEARRAKKALRNLVARQAKDKAKKTGLRRVPVPTAQAASPSPARKGDDWAGGGPTRPDSSGRSRAVRPPGRIAVRAK
jgi:hypothetical protein